MTRRIQPADEPLVSMAATAEYLGVSLETLRSWRKYGKGPKGYPLGRHVNFRLSEVEAWLQQRREPEALAITTSRRRSA